MNEHGFEPAANAFTTSPELTGPGFSTLEDGTYEHPGDAGPCAPGRWGLPQGYGQPDGMTGRGVFVPGLGGRGESVPPSGTPRRRSARRRSGPLVMAVLVLITICAVTVITFPHVHVVRLTPTDGPGAAASQHAPSVPSGRSSPSAEQFASYIPPGSTGLAVIADASGITGRG
jgi:hypothetical protein